MAGPARLTAVLAGVLLAHLLALEWFARQLEQPPVLQPLAPPMFTRLLQPQAGPVPAPRPRAVRKRPRPAPESALAASLPAAQQARVPQAEPAPQPQQPAEPLAAAEAEQPVAQAAAPEEPPQLQAPPQAPALDSWPTDTRLTYRLGGRYREGELHGDARVQWQREGGNYQVRLDIAIGPWVSMVMTSQGEVTHSGLAPRAYEESRRGKRRAAAFGGDTIALEGGRSAPRPDGVQDTASQFVELSHRFATGRDVLEVGRTVDVWLARPGGVELWTYDIAGREMLQTPHLGEVEAYHLKPRPLANPRGNVTAEMWFAPTLQYLPVRIRVNMGDTAHADLLVERIEQR
jgi:hypothetical protein